jgi:hypothetical protein
MEKNKLIGKFVKIEHGNIFDHYLLFGIIEEIDALDNIHLKISKIFHKTYFNKPRFFWWNVFFPKRDVVWYDYRRGEADWYYYEGDIITFPLIINNTRLTHQIELSDSKESNKYTRIIDELCKIKGGRFGLF